MIIETLYDKGTAEETEDIALTRTVNGFDGPHIIAVVADGVSSPYNPAEGPRLFHGRTGGQLVCEAIRNAVSDIGLGDTIESLVLMASLRIRELAMHHQLPMQRSDLLPGAAFVFARIDEKRIRIVQGADCCAVWERKDGTVNATRNQVFDHDSMLKELIAELMIRYNGDREKVWQKLMPILFQVRLWHVNKKGRNGYAILNGQEEAIGCCRRITLSRKRTRRLILFSDGMVPFGETKDRKLLGQMVMGLFDQGGLPAILRRTRKFEEEEQRTSHIHHAEATAISIEDLLV